MEKVNNLWKENKSKIIMLVLFLVMIIGLTYAWFQLTLNGTKTQTLNSGTLSLTLDDATSTGITMTNAYPITDAEGLNTTAYTFTLTNDGTISSDYTIYLDDLELTSGQTRMPDEYIKYNFTKDSGNVNTTGLLNSIGTNPNRILDSGTIEPNTTYSYTLRIWLDYDAGNEAQNKIFSGKLRVEAIQATDKTNLVYNKVFNATNLGANGSIVTTDPEQTFIAGTDPNNYIWYSGKLWRAVSMDPADKSVKLVTQWNQTAISSNDYLGSSNLGGSYAEMWLNDTGSDGFLGTLYNYNDFIKSNSSWNETMDTTTLGSITKPTKTNMVTDAVGLLNIYEYQMSYTGTTYSNGYLNNNLTWRTITPYSTTGVNTVSYYDGNLFNVESHLHIGLRPSINLKSTVNISKGDGTVDNPYILSGDETSETSKTLLNTRKSGEYINFGNGRLYRIVNIEDSKTKIVSSEPIKRVGYSSFKRLAFDSNSAIVLYTPTSSTNIGYFLNNDFLNSSNGYLTSDEISMLETNQIWYLGTVDGSSTNYSLSKCTMAGINCTKNAVSTTATVGMLRYGEQLSGQFNKYSNNSYYWTLTPYSAFHLHCIDFDGIARGEYSNNEFSFRPSMYLKPSVKITSGEGTKQNPFNISL